MENANSESEVISLGLSVIALNLGMYLGVPAIVVVGIQKRFYDFICFEAQFLTSYVNCFLDKIKMGMAEKDMI
jgi:hypothetical protein